MTTPHKTMLIQARDALLSACAGRWPGPMTPIFARPKFDGECKFKLMEDV